MSRKPPSQLTIADLMENGFSLATATHWQRGRVRCRISEQGTAMCWRVLDAYGWTSISPTLEPQDLYELQLLLRLTQDIPRPVDLDQPLDELWLQNQGLLLTGPIDLETEFPSRGWRTYNPDGGQRARDIGIWRVGPDWLVLIQFPDGQVRVLAQVHTRIEVRRLLSVLKVDQPADKKAHTHEPQPA